MEFLVDSNLGLPVNEKPWSDILAGLGVDDPYRMES